MEGGTGLKKKNILEINILEKNNIFLKIGKINNVSEYLENR